MMRLLGANIRTNFWPQSTFSNPKPVLPSKITNLLLRRLKARNNAKASLPISGSHQQDLGTIEAQDSQSDHFFQNILTTATDLVDKTSHNTPSTSDYLSTNYDLSFAGKEVSELSDFEMENSWTDVDEILSADDQIIRGREEAKSMGIMDLQFLDSVKSPNASSSFEIAEEMTVPIQENYADETSELAEPMSRMKYERSYSASLYALNGISECFRLKLGSGNSKTNLDPEELPTFFMPWNQEGSKREEHGGVHLVDQVVDSQQTSASAELTPSTSASSSPSNEGNELSLWSSLDLSAITMFFGGQGSSTTF